MRIKVVGVIGDAKDQDVFQSDLDKLVQWSERWQMELILSNARHYLLAIFKAGGSMK